MNYILAEREQFVYVELYIYVTDEDWDIPRDDFSI